MMIDEFMVEKVVRCVIEIKRFVVNYIDVFDSVFDFDKDS